MKHIDDATLSALALTGWINAIGTLRPDIPAAHVNQALECARRVVFSLEAWELEQKPNAKSF